MSEKRMLSDLSLDDRLTLLNWMRDALHAAAEKHVWQKTTVYFMQLFKTNQLEKFSVDDLWSRMPRNIQWHFEDVKKAIDHIDDELNKCDMRSADEVFHDQISEE